MKKNLAARSQILGCSIFVDILADPIAAGDKDLGTEIQLLFAQVELLEFAR